ncbi:conserved protein of unknown function [Pseudomonas marincola]|uniref:Uncharacterized protein n=1 Tax=Pseudomonas marincola TaxID=437900 RepID=A0A653E1F3_9PSED|nr:conserved protein of unknown function [Pseudomonas marincola]
MVNDTAKFISSTLVGVLWTAVSPVIAFTVAALLMSTGTSALIRFLESEQRIATSSRLGQCPETAGDDVVV